MALSHKLPIAASFPLRVHLLDYLISSQFKSIKLRELKLRFLMSTCTKHGLVWIVKANKKYLNH